MERNLKITSLRFAAATAMVIGLLLTVATGGGAAWAGTITGNIVTPTGGAVPSGTLGFILSQPAVLSGTGTVVTTQANCYTSATGNVVGLPDPLTGGSLTANTASGTLPAGTYYVRYSLWNASGESLASPEITVVLSAQGTVLMASPALQPANASGYKLYASSTSGTETLQATVTGFALYSQSTPLVSGAALPGANTSVCSIAFSDTLVPTGTSYRVSLLSKSGTPVSGFPQTWCTYGGLSGTINVSNGAPTGNCSTNGVYYPTPLWANNPINPGGTQSMTGSLNISANLLVGGSLTVNGTTNLLGAITLAGAATFNLAAQFPAGLVANGATVKVSGTGCATSLYLLNIDTTPTNPNKYFRVKQSNGALELMNSACNAVLVTFDNAGNVVVLGNLNAVNGVFSGNETAVNNTASGVTNSPVYQVNGTAQIFFVASDFTLAANTNLQAITGLSWVLQASTLQKLPFSCHLLYSQATAAVADQFGVQAASLAPTNFMAKARVQTNSAVYISQNLPILATTTATTVVTFTPSAITTVWEADIDGFIENPSGAANTINIMAQTSNASDLVTIKKDSFCRVN